MLATASLFCGSAFAQSMKEPTFLGPAIGVSISAQRNTLDISPAINSDYKADDSVAELVGSYGFAMGDALVGTVGMSLGLSKSKFGSVQTSTSDNPVKGKDHFSISFAPGLRLDKNSLVYAKVALHQMTVDFESTAAGYTTISKTYTGTGLGFGYAYAMNRNVELSAEYEVVNYGAVTVGVSEIKPKQSGLNFAVQYRF